MRRNVEHEREENPEADHGVHPPVPWRSQTLPGAKQLNQPETGKPGDQGGDPRLAGEAALDVFEECDLLLRSLQTGDGRQEHGGDEGDAADPKDDTDHVDQAGEGEFVHGASIPSALGRVGVRL
jgi:hypothetical protein